MELIKINEIITKEEETTETTKEFTLGRYSVELRTFEYPEGTYKMISVSKDYNDRNGIAYLPEIFVRQDFRKNKVEFKIQTTSYGGMDVREIKKIIDGYNYAIEAVEILTKEFC